MNKITAISLLIVLFLVMGTLSKCKNDSKTTNTATSEDNTDKDRAGESLSGLAAQLQKIQQEGKNRDEQYEKEFIRLNKENDEYKQQLQNKHNENADASSQQIQAQLDKFQQTLQALQSKKGNSSQNEYEIKADYENIVWRDFNESVDPNGLGLQIEGEAEQNKALPFYTIPLNSTLMRSKAMTALIGRVPVSGSVSDPIPFKIITGNKTLVSNGHELPEIEKAIWSGEAIGDSTLKCVTGRIRSVTFVFKDGTIYTTPNGSVESIGWISNNKGVQCLPGQFVTNAPKVMRQLFLAGTLSGAAGTIAQNQITTTAFGTSIVTGDTAKAGLANGLNVGLSEWASYVRERARDQFDAVIVEPGADVAIHLTENIHIDYQINGRKLRYGAATTNNALGVD